MKFTVVSLGCPKNLTDAEVLAGELLAAGHQFVSDDSEAEAVIINTCAFLRSAVREAEGEIRHYLVFKKRGLYRKVIVTGCLSEAMGENLLKKYPGLNAVVGIHRLSDITKAFRKDGCYITGQQDGPIYSPLNKMRFTAGHSAYLKIADGCDNRCAYCLIPFIRGRFRSKPLEQLVREAGDLADSGAVEISLIAQDTTRYGEDIYGEPYLDRLLKELVKIKSVRWWRIMYAYPERVTDGLISVMRDNGTVCRYLDIPLQHISTPVLRAMRRLSTEDSIKEKIESLRSAMPDIALRTNFIAGFPGETDKDAEKLVSFIKETKFSNVGVFEYSPEKGTAAAEMDGQIPEEVKHARAEAVIEAQSRVLDGLNKELIGRETVFLADSEDRGRAFWDAPDIDGSVVPESHAGLSAGKFYSGRIISADAYVRKVSISGPADGSKK